MCMICGVFYIAGQNDEGELTSLSESSIAGYTEYFSNIDIINTDEVSECIKCEFRII